MRRTKPVKLLFNFMFLFGSEKPLNDAPDERVFHHEGLTRTATPLGDPATTNDKWSEQAQNALAFHTDYVDSYLYNPLWWFDVLHGGGPGRLSVALSTQSNLEKLHFDDLFNNYNIAQMWRRYLSGTICGLVWAHETLPEQQKVSCAHNLIGTGLHAIQDFYSHSNWIDLGGLGGRREMTWFEASDSMRFSSNLYTGYYERPAQSGVLPHGKFQPICAVLDGTGVARGLLKIACHAASPFAKSSVCEMFRRCDSAKPVSIPVRDEFVLPEGVAWVDDNGMNLDSRWQAEWGVATRGTRITPPVVSRRGLRCRVRAGRQVLVPMAKPDR